MLHSDDVKLFVDFETPFEGNTKYFGKNQTTPGILIPMIDFRIPDMHCAKINTTSHITWKVTLKKTKLSSDQGLNQLVLGSPKNCNFYYFGHMIDLAPSYHTYLICIILNIYMRS